MVINQTHWKTIAIVFIILFVLESLFLIWIFKLGFEDVDNENMCIINVCNGYDAYTYIDGVCSCYNNHELLYQEYLS